MDIKEQVVETAKRVWFASDYPKAWDEIADQIVPLVRADMQREIGDGLSKYLHFHRGEWCFTPKMYSDLRGKLESGTFKEGE